MGYSLSIGELVVEFDNDEDCPRVNCSAKIFQHDNAPAFGEPTDTESQRWPSYSSWANFCRFVDLYDLFFGKNEKGEYTRDDALIQHHPDCIPLTEKHRREINAAYDNFKIKYPAARATYGNPKSMLEPDEDNPEENGQLCRLVWLHYWVNWALDNCEKPVFENT